LGVGLRSRNTTNRSGNTTKKNTKESMKEEYLAEEVNKTGLRPLKLLRGQGRGGGRTPKLGREKKIRRGGRVGVKKKKTE